MSPRLTITIAVLAGGLAGVIGAGLTRGDDPPERVVTVTTERPTTETTERRATTTDPPYVPDYGDDYGDDSTTIEVPEPQTTQTTRGALRCGVRASDPSGCHPADDPIWDIADELARRDMQDTMDSLDREIECSGFNDDPSC